MFKKLVHTLWTLVTITIGIFKFLLMLALCKMVKELLMFFHYLQLILQEISQLQSILEVQQLLSLTYIFTSEHYLLVGPQI